MGPVDQLTATGTLSSFQDRARRALEEVFGHDSFREGQAKALAAVEEGRDCLVIMPTGSGKSLCYQVPALCLPGVTLVVSPLIALMKDQVDALRLRGVPVTFINSSLSIDEQWERLESLRAGAYRLVYVAPERFRNRSFRKALAAVKVSLLAVDEAHCISQWGHDFRPDYRRLQEVRELLAGVRAIALTATATPEVQADIVRELKMENPVRVVTGFDRPNLSYAALKLSNDAQKLEALGDFLSRLFREAENDSPPPGIIYTGTRRHAEEVAAFLEAAELPGSESGERPFCRPYHAGLEDAERREVQEDFMEGRLPCVAATNAFGMGVDKADIRYVVHYDLPGSIEAYYQEVGRAGRDGLPAECLLLFSEADRRLQEYFIEGSNPSRETIEGVHEFLWGLGENPIFRSLVELEVELESSGALEKRASSMAFRSALAVIERAGGLERLDHYENLAEVAPASGKPWVENPYAERAAVKHRLWEALRRVFERSEGEPAGVAVEHWAEAMELGSDGLRRGLANLAEDGWIRYTPPFRGRAIRLPEEYKPLAALGVDFAALARRRRRDEERLEQVLALARARDCRRDRILRHFGEKAPPGGCGICDSCRGKRAPLRDARGSAAEAAGKARPLSEEEFTMLRKVLSGVARIRGRCGRRRLVQMLIGSRSKAVAELGLDRLSTYGILAELRRDEVKEIVLLLEAADCLRELEGRFPAIVLTERGRRVMLAEERIELAWPPELCRPAAAAPAGRRDGAGGRGPPAEDEEAYDEELFQRLRGLRRKIAAGLGVPAYRVFSDRTLKAMARLQPRDAQGLLAVPGVGQVSLERFGEAFLREIGKRGE
jgi:ATP-dependent DNA helicase RecQ